MANGYKPFVMFEKYKATLKSSETEDWLDYRFVRPFSYLWACLFARLGVHPNTVTVLSMLIGAAASVFFFHGSFYYEGHTGLVMNLIGVALLIWADVYDCTDGQLARMTGKKSRLGRILDGAAGFAWFVPIYVALVLRFWCHHTLEFSCLGLPDTPVVAAVATLVVFVLGLASGSFGIGSQQRLADYYIQVHLYVLKGGKGSELDDAAEQQAAYDATPKTAPWWWRWFLSSYASYTRKQEQATPEFQRLRHALHDRYGDIDHVPAALREEIHQRSRELMGWNAMLTFNFRSGMFFLFCLADVPALYFVFEIAGMGLLAYYVNRRHERFCRQINEELSHNS